MTARERYDTMIRQELGPWLRLHGFKNRRNVFRREDNSGWQVVEFQASQFGSRDDTAFTINLKIGLPELSGSKAVVDMRIGRLLPGGEDRWWSVDARTDLARLADDVRSALDERALPWLDERGSLDQLARIAQRQPDEFPRWALSRFAMLLSEAGLLDLAADVEQAERFQSADGSP
jgi:hypothetical protein